jgi:hypothetical protein
MNTPNKYQYATYEKCKHCKCMRPPTRLNKNGACKGKDRNWCIAQVNNRDIDKLKAVKKK